MADDNKSILDAIASNHAEVKNLLDTIALGTGRIEAKVDRIEADVRELKTVVNRSTRSSTGSKRALRNSKLGPSGATGDSLCEPNRRSMPGPERVPGAVWPGTAGVGEDGSTYCLWSFPPGSASAGSLDPHGFVGL